MSPLEFYLSEQNDPSILSFVDEKALDLSLLKNKPVGFVEDNFLTFEATRAILWGGARRVSTDGKWLEFASLAESTYPEHVNVLPN